jgi:hypothetical protein
VDVISTPSYISAVGHVAENSQSAPADVVSTPLALSPPESASGSMGSTTYDLAGLNLTVIVRDANVQPQGAADDEQQ